MSTDRVGGRRRLIRRVGEDGDPGDVILTVARDGDAYRIQAVADGGVVGELKFTVWDPDDRILYVNYVDVREDYRNRGIGLLLYRKFGEVYGAEFAGWHLRRAYHNPVAEYLFHKAVALGYFPADPNALDEDYVYREYDGDAQRLWETGLVPRLIDLRRRS